MTNQEYNGWYNYETWCVNLWMDNEQYSQAFWTENAQEIYERCFDNADPSSVLTVDQNAYYEFSEVLKDHFEDNTPEAAGVYADLLNAALSEVNWFEIAKHWIDQYTENK